MNDAQNTGRRYIGQVYLALNHYKNILNGPTIIVGDFNWNAIWDDKPGYPLYGNLSDTVAFLADYSIRSVYHGIFKEEFGKETNPTLFMHHKKEKSYHVDYCFTSGNFKTNRIQVGVYSEWIASSDHMPLIIDIIK
jgi:endonuclease/exonuclease/phosphatase family metal-dependent hydrolase